MENFIKLLKKYGLILSKDKMSIIHPDSNKKIEFNWNDIPKTIMEIENLHPNVDAEKEILEVLEEQIKINFFNLTYF